MIRLDISGTAAATLISLALIIQAPTAVIAWSEFIGFTPATEGERNAIARCDLPPVACTTDSDCEDKNPHLVGCDD